jgi:hypothetical protein
LSEHRDKIYQRVLKTLGVELQDSRAATREAIADFARFLKTGKISALM